MDELAELQKEFRASVLNGLAELKAMHKSIDSDLRDIRMKMVDGEAFKDLQGRVTSLEKTKTQLVTAIVVIQGIFLGIWTLVTTIYDR